MALPLVALLPLHAPEAVHVVAFAVVQVSTLWAPELTAVGLAVSVTVGAGDVPDDGGTGDVTGGGVTVADTLIDALAPAPLHSNVNVEVAVRFGIDSIPEVARGPLQLPLAMQAVAFWVDHESCTDPPLRTIAALEAKSIVTAAGVGVDGGFVSAAIDGEAASPPPPQPHSSTSHTSWRPLRNQLHRYTRLTIAGRLFPAGARVHAWTSATT